MKSWFKSLIRSLESENKIDLEESLKGKYDLFKQFLEARRKASQLRSSLSQADPKVIPGQVAQAINFLSRLSERGHPDLFEVLRELERQGPPGVQEHQQDPSVPGRSTPRPLQPGECRTLEDILACAHDLAAEVLFQLPEKYDLSKAPTKKVQTGLPINLHVIDLDGGLSGEKAAKAVPREQILSLPLQAMFRGMFYPGISWSGPIGVNLKGLMVIMAQSSSRPEEDFWDKTYALISREYMGYNSRLGYHYSSVDSYCSGETADNFIRFMFKGGAADDMRRARRARFIGAVLERIGFAVEVQKDLVNASFRREPQSRTEESLDLIGRLMGCCRQRDMVMDDDALIGWYTEAFLKGNYSFTP